ncbi:putative ribonuclease H-like domain-containing protein [Tanacetum coccineum]|uniref:Ribonuclease H-like domain-containing protein n=1 Tax=Tanacetum coccineum TaxID=301880 RepID=A0ABQ5BH96_9ASTR
MGYNFVGDSPEEAAPCRRNNLAILAVYLLKCHKVPDAKSSRNQAASLNEVSTASGNFRVNTAGGTSSTSQVSFYSPGANEESFRRQEELGFSKETTLLPLISQMLECYQLGHMDKGTLLRNANQEGTKGKDLMVIIVEGMQQQMIITSTGGSRWSRLLCDQSRSILTSPAVVDSGCSSHMTANHSYLSDYKDYNGGFVAFGSDPKRGLDNHVNMDCMYTQNIMLQKELLKAAKGKNLFENSPKDNDVKDSEDVAKKEEQHTMTEAEQVLKDDLERMIAQEIAAKAIDDATRQAFEEEKKRAAQATSINKLNTVGFMMNEDVGAEADFNNMDNTIDVSPIPTLRVHKDHPKGQILGDPKSAVQTRGKIQKDSLVQQALEEGIHYDEVFAPVAMIEAIMLFLAFTSFMGFPLYQMDVKSAFLYGTIEEEVYVHQPPGFVDAAHPNKFYKVIKALYGLHQAPRAWDSPFELEAFSDSDYGGASLDRKSTTGGCQFLGRRLISWQCKKQTIMANSTTEENYISG